MALAILRGRQDMAGSRTALARLQKESEAMLGLGLVDKLPDRAPHEPEQKQCRRRPADGDQQRAKAEDRVVDDALVQHRRDEIATDEGAKDGHANVLSQHHGALGFHDYAGEPSNYGADRAPDIRVDRVLQKDCQSIVTAFRLAWLSICVGSAPGLM